MTQWEINNNTRLVIYVTYAAEPENGGRVHNIAKDTPTNWAIVEREWQAIAAKNPGEYSYHDHVTYLEIVMQTDYSAVRWTARSMTATEFKAMQDAKY